MPGGAHRAAVARRGDRSTRSGVTDLRQAGVFALVTSGCQARSPIRGCDFGPGADPACRLPIKPRRPFILARARCMSCGVDAAASDARHPQVTDKPPSLRETARRYRTSRSADRIRVRRSHCPCDDRRGALRGVAVTTSTSASREATSCASGPTAPAACVGVRAATGPACASATWPRTATGSTTRRSSTARAARRVGGRYRRDSSMVAFPAELDGERSGLVDTDLIELAAAHGVATSYRDGERQASRSTRSRRPGAGLLDVDAAAAATARRPRWPPARDQAAAGAAARHHRRTAAAVRAAAARARRADRRRGHAAATVTELPADLAPGWYRLDWSTTAGHDVTWSPRRRCRETPRSWGWMLQLYALHSAGSWGIGDLGDLRDVRRWTGREHGAGAVLLNPLHAITPGPAGAGVAVHAVEPAVRNPLALRITDLAAYRARRRRHPGRGRRAAPGRRRRPDRARPGVGGQARGARAAVARRPGGRSPSDAPDDLWQFAMFCALAERYGGPVEPLARGAAAPGGARTSTAAAPSWPRGSPSTPGCRTGAASSWPTCAAAAREVGRAGRARPRRRLRPGGRRRLGAAGRARAWACTSARRRTRSASRARTGACRRGGRTGSTPPATPPTATCCGPCCGTPTGCGSTTSPGCGGCGGCRRASPRTAAPTCTTTPRHARGARRWRRTGPARW